MGAVRILSESTVVPAAGEKHSAENPRRCELSVWDLSMLSFQYVQKGLLFVVPSGAPPSEAIAEHLKSSLSEALRYFYPLAGRFASEKASESGDKFLHIDCGDQGASFVLASADGVTVADVLDQEEGTPSFVRDFFPLNGAFNYKGQFLPLLAVQLTKLENGVFLGCSFNHAVGDGASFWNFLNAWADISRSWTTNGGRRHPGLFPLPVHKKWFLEGTSLPIKLPLSLETQFLRYYSPPPLRKKTFHFCGDTLAQLKVRVNQEKCAENTISSFQVLSALTWRCISRARRLPAEQKVGCRLAAGNRRRLRPPLPATYFGNSVFPITITITAGELLGNNLTWVAEKLNQSVASYTNEMIREMAEKWMAAPAVYRDSDFDRFCVTIFGSPRFQMYGCDFGWGKAVGLRSGGANLFDGKVTACPGKQGGSSIDLEVWLAPETMFLLESDEELTQVLSIPSSKL